MAVTVLADQVFGSDSVVVLSVTQGSVASLFYAQQLTGFRRDHALDKFSPYINYLPVEIGDFALVYGSDNFPTLGYKLLETEEDKEKPYHVKPYYKESEEPGTSNLNWVLENPQTPELFSDEAYEKVPPLPEGDKFLVWLSGGSPYRWITVEDSLFTADVLTNLLFSVYDHYEGDERIEVWHTCYLDHIPDDWKTSLGIHNSKAVDCDGNGHVYIFGSKFGVKTNLRDDYQDGEVDSKVPAHITSPTAARFHGILNSSLEFDDVWFDWDDSTNYANTISMTDLRRAWLGPIDFYREADGLPTTKYFVRSNAGRSVWNDYEESYEWHTYPGSDIIVSIDVIDKVDEGTVVGTMVKPDESFFYIGMKDGKIYKYTVTDGDMGKTNRVDEYTSVVSEQGFDLVNISAADTGKFYYELGFISGICISRYIKIGLEMSENWKLSTAGRKGKAYFYCEFEPEYEGPDPQLDHIEGQRQVISLRDVYRHRFDHRLSTCETVYDWRIRTWESGSHEILEVTAYFNISDFPKVGDDRDFVFGSMVDKLGWKQIELSNIQAPVFSNTMEQTMEIYSDFAVCERPGVVALAFSTEGDFYFEVGSDGRVEKFIPLEKWHVWPSRRTFVYDFGVTDLRDGFCDPTSLFVTDKEYSYEIPFDMLECFRVYEKVYIRDETWIYDRISGNVILVQDQVGVTEEIVVHANPIVSVYDSTIGMDVGHLTIED